MKGFFFYASLFTEERERHEENMVDVIYLDIDGTLRDEVKGIPKSAVWAINQCHKRQIKIVICTGRNAGSIQDDVMALPIDGIISGGGCYIEYHHRHLWKKHFPENLIGRIMTMVSDYGLSLALETEQKIYMDQNMSAFYQQDFQKKIERCDGGKDRKKVSVKHKIFYKDNFEDFQSESQKIHKICMIGEKESVNTAQKILIQEVELIQKKEWNSQWYMELLPKDCNKGSAVTFLNEKLGVHRVRTISFGDSENDIAMMDATGAAVVVGGENELVKQHASSVCEPVMEDGICKELIRRKIIR